jgi:hypothetical protein
MTFATYIIGGALSVYFFKINQADKFKEISWKEASILSITTGLTVAGILSLIYIVKLQDHDTQMILIDAINKVSKMHSGSSDREIILQLSTELYIAMILTTFIICSTFSLFGGLAIFPLVNKAKK